MDNQNLNATTSGTTEQNIPTEAQLKIQQAQEEAYAKFIAERRKIEVANRWKQVYGKRNPKGKNKGKKRL